MTKEFADINIHNDFVIGRAISVSHS
jgi:hypothetical protein